MRQARDTFLHYLSDNLTGATVNYVRKDAANPNKAKPIVNAVNVCFLNDLLSTHVSRLMVSIDALFYDENAALDQVGSVVTLLQSSAYTPKLDYAVPTAPVATGTNLYWNPFTITFKRVESDLYFHYSCTLAISHRNQ